MNAARTALLLEVAIAAVLLLLWNNALIYPLKVLVVFFHEFSHVLATWLSGGRVIEWALNPQQGGHTLSAGGARTIILSAGYLGSLLIGAAILHVARRSRADGDWMIALGVLIIGMTLFYGSGGFSWFYGLSAGVLMLIAGRYLPNAINDAALRVIGLASIFYVPLDIWSDTIARDSGRSDAAMLADHLGGTTMMWGALWLAIALWVAWRSLRGAWRDAH
jgi:hypothetical protein